MVQAKRYSGSVGNAAVQQIVAAMRMHSSSGAIVVTNSFFTRSAKELAQANSVDLVDRRELIDWLDEHDADA